MGRSTGSRNVFSRLKTWAIKTPIGFVIARMIKKKTRICNQPLMVISEFLRAQDRVGQIDKHQGTNHQAQYRFEILPNSPHSSSSQPLTHPIPPHTTPP